MARQCVAHLLTILALVFAPISLLTGTATAMPMTADGPAAAHHVVGDNAAADCAEMADNQLEEGKGAGSSDSDCRVKCAVSCSAVPLLASPAIEPLALSTEIPSARLVNALTGLAPEAADPPPRPA